MSEIKEKKKKKVSASRYTLHTHSPAPSVECRTLRLCIQLPCTLFAQSASDCQYGPSPICCHMRDDAVVA